MTDIATDAADGITEDSATLNGTITNFDDDAVYAAFQWRETGASSWTETSRTAYQSNTSYSESLTSLDGGTEYEFRAFIDIVNIGVDTTAVSNVGDDQATLNADISSMVGVDSVDVYFEWGETGGGFPNSTTPQTITSDEIPTTHSEIITGLSESTDYEYRTVADATDFDVTYDTETFTTDSASAFIVLETWESYTDGDSINSAAEWSGSDIMEVHSVTDVEGSLAGGYIAQEPWQEEVISLPGGSDEGQTDTYESYPTPDCTYRFAFRVNGAIESLARVLFCIPDAETTTLVDNAYIFDVSDTNTRIRSIVGGSVSTEFSFGSALSVDTTYDVAVEVEDTGSQVDFTCTIYEWGGSSWSQWGSETGSDTDRHFPTDSGIGISGIAGDGSATSGFVVDNLRFADTLNESGTPEWTP